MKTENHQQLKMHVKLKGLLTDIFRLKHSRKKRRNTKKSGPACRYILHLFLLSMYTSYRSLSEKINVYVLHYSLSLFKKKTTLLLFPTSS